ncbi:hypothetical protein [Candidatus Methanoperedens nitratireducens]|nr:hypothetical protein [Candidatus Methanoperedens nitroreducens]
MSFLNKLLRFKTLKALALFVGRYRYGMSTKASFIILSKSIRT